MPASGQATEVYYFRASFNEPWCCGWAPYPDANPNGFNAVFGAGGWNLVYYETAVAASIFDANTCYVYMEGGDGHAWEMESFLTTNMTLIQNWVNSGGSLFLNAAPNEDNGMSWGFGGVWLYYPYWWSWNVVAATGMTSHPIFLGPFTPVTTSYSGSYFTHAYATGGGVTNIINDISYVNYPALTYKTWGAGTVFFGGMTTASWHSPVTEAANLRCNMHSYLAGLCALVLPVEFSRFEAIADHQINRLSWEVVSEIDVDHYLVERSVDGISWNEIAEVGKDEFSSGPGIYQTEDLQPVPGKSYYRIKMMRTDGHWGYSVVDDVERDGSLTVYPVPAADVLYLETENGTPQSIQVIDASGRIVPVEICNTYGKIALRVATLEPGIYTLICSGTCDRTETRTFVKL